LDAHALLSYARRRFERDPDLCPIEPGDAGLLLATLAILAAEAEIEAADEAADLAAAQDAKRLELARGFRKAFPSRLPPARAPGQAPKPEEEGGE
jgi:hypothetical protein